MTRRKLWSEGMIQTLDQFDFHHRLAQTQGPALILFTAPACGSCKRLRRALTQEAWPEIHLFEVDASRDLALTREFDLFHLPALFLYMDGRFHAEIQAEADGGAIRKAVAAALCAPAQEAP